MKTAMQPFRDLCHVVNAGAGKVVVVFDMHGYSDPNTIMPTFLVGSLLHLPLPERAACICADQSRPYARPYRLVPLFSRDEKTQ
jgi:hypothetical protein